MYARTICAVVGFLLNPISKGTPRYTVKVADTGMVLARKQSNRGILPLFCTQRQWMESRGHGPLSMGMLSQLLVYRLRLRDMSILFLISSYRVTVARLSRGYHMQKVHQRPHLSMHTQSNMTDTLLLGDV